MITEFQGGGVLKSKSGLSKNEVEFQGNARKNGVEFQGAVVKNDMEFQGL